MTRQQALNECDGTGGDFWDCATGCMENYGSDDCAGFMDCANLCPGSLNLIEAGS